MPEESEPGTIEKYGYVRWIIQPPFDLLYTMLEYFKARYKDGRNMWPKLFMAADAYGIHELSIEFLRYLKQPVIRWHLIMDEYRRSREAQIIRNYTVGSPSLSYYAGVKFLEDVLKRVKSLNYGNAKLYLMNPVMPGEEARLASIARASASIVLEAVEARVLYEEAFKRLEARVPGRLKGLEQSSLLFASPDELRRGARILDNIARLIDEFKPSEGRRVGIGYPNAYTISSRISEYTIKDFLYPEPLRSLRLATIHYGYEKASGRRFNVFIDRSGSMGESMPGSDIEKVAVASALAISLILEYEDVSVYAFDVDVRFLGRGSLAIDPLLMLTADGGTSVQKALDVAGGLDGESVIITDAIDPYVSNVPDNAYFIILEPAAYYPWIVGYIKAGRGIIANRPIDVLEFLGPRP